VPFESLCFYWAPSVLNMNRTVLHMRIDGFPVAVERLRDSSLRGRPVVVCPRHSPRSLVFSASAEARREGVWEGQPLTLALKRCRRLVVLPPDEKLYARAGAAIVKVLSDYSPLVEPGRWGRFYVDMSGMERLFGSLQDAAFRMRREVAEQLRLPGTLGLGANKLVSGAAARVIQSHGDLYTVPQGSEASFMAPLRVQRLPAINNRKDRELLRELNLHHVHEVADLSLMQLAAVFGKRAAVLHRQALGIDDRPVQAPSSKPFVLEEETLAEDSNDDALLLGLIHLMMERACRRMRQQGLLPRTVWMHIRHADGVDVTRRMKLPQPTVTDRLLFPSIQGLYLKCSARRHRVRYLSLTFTDLILPTQQMMLFDLPSENPKEEALVTALDRIRQQYGMMAVGWGRMSN